MLEPVQSVIRKHIQLNLQQDKLHTEPKQNTAK